MESMSALDWSRLAQGETRNKVHGSIRARTKLFNHRWPTERELRCFAIFHRSLGGWPVPRLIQRGGNRGEDGHPPHDRVGGDDWCRGGHRQSHPVICGRVVSHAWRCAHAIQKQETSSHTPLCAICNLGRCRVWPPKTLRTRKGEEKVSFREAVVQNAVIGNPFYRPPP